MITVVTSFNGDGYEQYGREFIETFDKHWPPEVGLTVYTDGEVDAEVDDQPDRRRAYARRRLETLGPWQYFMQRYAASDTARGKVAMPCWRSGERVAGRSFRTDAVKFCHKVFSIYHTARTAAPEDDGLIWIDADVSCFKDITIKEITALLGEGDVAYLGRENYHSECGFLYFRLPQGLPLIDEWCGFYTSGAIFNLYEWHDSYVFDRTRERFPNLRYRNLSGDTRTAWLGSPLMEWMDHRKGQRKFGPKTKEERILASGRTGEWMDGYLAGGNIDTPTPLPDAPVPFRDGFRKARKRLSLRLKNKGVSL